jgi:hypothetical protein
MADDQVVFFQHDPPPNSEDHIRPRNDSGPPTLTTHTATTPSTSPWLSCSLGQVIRLYVYKWNPCNMLIRILRCVVAVATSLDDATLVPILFVRNARTTSSHVNSILLVRFNRSPSFSWDQLTPIREATQRLYTPKHMACVCLAPMLGNTGLPTQLPTRWQPGEWQTGVATTQS